MIAVRPFMETDFDGLDKLDHFLWLELKFHGDFSQENAFTALDESGAVVGAGCMSYDGTWRYLEDEAISLPEYYMQLEYRAVQGHPEEVLIYEKLLYAMKEHLRQLKKSYPGKRLALRSWCQDSQNAMMEFLLEAGFCASRIIMVLSFDLQEDIPVFPVRNGIKITPHSFGGEGMRRYLEANRAGFDGVQDSEAEMWFRLNGDTTMVFTAKDGDRVVAGTTIWGMGNGRSATENVFTIPEYRRQHLASATLCEALRELKRRGEKEVTLTVTGENQAAIQMYLGMGYHLKYNLHEMHYTL